MQGDIEYQMRPDIILVHSPNIAILEQKSFMSQERTLCLVCTGEHGFAAVGARAPKKGYITIERWLIHYPGAVSFCVPNSKLMSIQQVSLEALKTRYQSEQECWCTIRNATRYHAVTLIPPGNTPI